VVLALDGSYKNDSTVVLGCTVEEHPHLFVLGMWERDPNADESWRVDIQEVEETVRQACRTFNVKEVNCDPYRWARTIQLLEDEGLPMMEFPQSPNRMVPATQRLYEAVLNDGVTHDGDPRLARHIENAALKIDSRGARLSKEGEGRKIDAAVTAVMAFDRAATLATEPDPRPKRVYGFGY
jgi:phage terminase large subunit-like protein